MMSLMKNCAAFPPLGLMLGLGLGVGVGVGLVVLLVLAWEWWDWACTGISGYELKHRRNNRAVRLAGTSRSNRLDDQVRSHLLNQVRRQIGGIEEAIGVIRLDRNRTAGGRIGNG